MRRIRLGLALLLFPVAAPGQTLADQAAVAMKSTVAIFGCFGPSASACVGKPAPGEEPQWLRLGSGVVVSQGVVATAQHVLKADLPPLALRVVCDLDWGGKKDYPALIAADDSGLDLAALAVAGLSAPAASLASKDDIRVGAEVFFVGHPTIVPGPTLGTGVVATAELPWIIDGKPRPLYGLAAAVNRGNSGGGVFLRSSGKLLGLVNAKAGSLGANLQTLRDAKFSGGIAIKGVDPVAALQQTLRELDANLQLGIGAFSGVDHVAAFLASANKH